MKSLWSYIMRFLKREKKQEQVKSDQKPVDDMPQVDIIAGGEDFRGAKVTVNITAESSKAGTTITYPKTGWKPYDADCNGFVGIVYRLPNGKVKGGKFDWLPEHHPSYHWGFKHLADGYKGHEQPQDGAECWVFIFNIDKSERSNGVRFIW